MASRLADFNSVEQFIEDQENQKYEKENSTECCFTQGISDAEEGVKTYRRNSPEGVDFLKVLRLVYSVPGGRRTFQT